MDIEMGRTVGDAHAQHATRFGAGLGRFELERHAVEFVGHLLGHPESRGQPVSARHRGRAAFEKVAACPPRASEIWVPHDASSLWVFIED